jgi:putative flippase GtrA
MRYLKPTLIQTNCKQRGDFLHMIALKRLLSHRIVRFLLTGVLNTLLGYLLFAGLLNLGMTYPYALLVATVVGVFINYFSYSKLAFLAQHRHSTLLKFIVAYGLVYGLNLVLLKTLIALNLTPYLAQVFCIPVSVLVSYILLNFWVFKGQRNDCR